MRSKKSFLIEGFTEEEINELSTIEEFQKIVFSDEPVIFKAGTSEILGSFSKDDKQLEITLSHITGGGEGVLLKILNMFRGFAKRNQIQKIKWIIHAVDCPKPNPKLPRVLEKKKFKIVVHPTDGEVYTKTELIE